MKPMRKMLIGVAVLFVFIFGYKMLKGYFIGRYMAAHHSPVVYVSVKEADDALWQPQYKASSNLRAVLGVNVTTELAGSIRQIYFKPGMMVHQGDLMVQLNIDPDVAQLRVLEANAKLADVSYQRDKAQFAIHAISQAALDVDEANLKSALAQVDRQKAIIEQKTIRAPFSGRLGISAVNPGQYLNPGDKITMLQTLDPIYVDFFVPQQSIGAIKVGQSVTVETDAFPNEKFVGQVTTINPGVDVTIRNVEVEATISNANMLLAPGMFASITVDTGQPTPYLTLPQTAISFNSYGATVYLVKEGVAKQAFVITGEKRGDQIVILKGVKKGDKVVTSGQLKLQNGSAVAINNTMTPMNEISPTPVDE